MTYLHKINKPPTEITREEFLDEIFVLGHLYEYGYDTIVGAVELADRFMLVTEPRQSYHEHITLKPSNSPEYEALVTTPITQIYSKELVVVALTLAGKTNEDDPHSIKYGLTSCENYYIVKMEWEIARCFHYHIRVNNFMTCIGLAFDDGMNCIGLTKDGLSYQRLGPVFGELAKDVCRIPNWWTFSPLSIVLGTMWLYQQGKLRAVTTSKEMRFAEFVNVVAAECEEPPSKVLQAYIDSHK